MGVLLGVAVTVTWLGEGDADGDVRLWAVTIAAAIKATDSTQMSAISIGFGLDLNSSESSVSYCQGASESSNRLSMLLPSFLFG